jgi:hypothetical protein
MDRRSFLLTSLAGGLAAPHGAVAQQPGKVVSIGIWRWRRGRRSLHSIPDGRQREGSGGSEALARAVMDASDAMG